MSNAKKTTSKRACSQPALPAAPPEAERPWACPTCDSGDVTAAYRQPPGTWKCQTCGAVWQAKPGAPPTKVGRVRVTLSYGQARKLLACAELRAAEHDDKRAWLAIARETQKGMVHAEERAGR